MLKHLLVGAVAALAFSAPALAQSSKDIVGTWDYVSAETVAPDGKRTPTFGPNPKGIVIFQADGYYALIVTRADAPKFASNNRMQGTPEENKAIVQASISHFGKYTVNEADKTITFQVKTSTFPNWDGIDQKRPFTLSGDELKYTVPVASGRGGTAEVVLKRIK
jgi:Lipocalin-like domain